MKHDFRCELTVHGPRKFLEQLRIHMGTVNPAELKRVDWIWEKRPEKKGFTKWAVYVGIVASMTISGQAHSAWFSFGSAIASVLALEILDHIRRKRLTRWSQTYQSGIHRLLASRGEDNTSGGRPA
jgi:hypothetical protein